MLALIFKIPPSTAAILYLSNTWVPFVPATIFTPPNLFSISVLSVPIFKVPIFLRLTPTASLDITTILAPVKVIGLEEGVLKSNSRPVAFPLRIISPFDKLTVPPFEV